MSNNREKRVYKEYVHLYLALQRTGTSKDKKCLRQVIKDEELDLKILEAKCKIFGGEWRIHKTVNTRNVQKARKILLKRLIDHPEKASIIDTEWRTALLQKECKATNYFMFDIDTKDYNKLSLVNYLLCENHCETIQEIETFKGWHYITKPFDTREICKLDYVTLLRDGYAFVKEIKCS